MVFFRDFVKLDNGQQLVFVVFENIRTKVVAVAITHALLVDTYFHLSLLLASAGRLVLNNLKTILMAGMLVFTAASYRFKRIVNQGKSGILYRKRDIRELATIFSSSV
jgi:hypothetical protein